MGTEEYTDEPGTMGPGAAAYAGLAKATSETQDDHAAALAMNETRDKALARNKTFGRPDLVDYGDEKAIAEAGETAAKRAERARADAEAFTDLAVAELQKFKGSQDPDAMLRESPDGSRGVPLVSQSTSEHASGPITTDVAISLAERLGVAEQRADAKAVPFEPSKEFADTYNNIDPETFATLDTPIEGGMLRETVGLNRETRAPEVLFVDFVPSDPEVAKDQSPA